MALAIDVQGREAPASQSGQHPLPAVALAPSSSATAPPLLRSSQPVTAPMPRPAVALPPSYPPAASTFRRNPAATVPAPESFDEPRRQSHSSPELHLSTQLLTEFGMLRRLAEGPSVGLRLDVARWSLSATAEWILPQWKQMPDSTENKGGHISFLGGQIGPCLAGSAYPCLRRRRGRGYNGQGLRRVQCPAWTRYLARRHRRAGIGFEDNFQHKC